MLKIIKKKIAQTVDYDGYSHCEIDRKNIPYVGEKYNVILDACK